MHLQKGLKFFLPFSLTRAHNSGFSAAFLIHISKNVSRLAATMTTNKRVHVLVLEMSLATTNQPAVPRVANNIGVSRIYRQSVFAICDKSKQAHTHAHGARQKG